MKNNESEEMYLETILRLKKRMPCVRSIDIAEERNFAKSSVSRAVNLLKGKNYITINPNGEINFTDTGFKHASDVFERHCVLTKFFVLMGADKSLAEENACRIEHVITSDLFEIIKEYVKNNSKN